MKIVISFILLISTTHAIACGSISQRLYGYWGLKDLDKKSTFLESNSCPFSKYYAALDADPIIAEVLIDAIESGVSDKIIKNALKSYNCAFGARNTEKYQVIRNYITEEKYSSFCDMKRLNTIKIVNAEGGLVLRSKPNKRSKRLSAIANGTQVEVISLIGDWAHVKAYTGKGYVYYPLLTAY